MQLSLSEHFASVEARINAVQVRHIGNVLMVFMVLVVFFKWWGVGIRYSPGGIISMYNSCSFCFSCDASLHLHVTFVLMIVSN